MPNLPTFHLLTFPPTSTTFSGGEGNTLPSPADPSENYLSRMYDIPSMVSAGLKIIDKVIPDADAKNRAKEIYELEVMKLAGSESAKQSEVNAVEAASPSLFVSGWRPFCGWVSALGFAWATLGQPVFSWVYTVATHQPAPVIALPTDILMTTMMGLLGLGSLRTIERLKGVASK